MSTRLCKAILTAGCAFFFLLVVFNNLSDYWSNYRFVEGVLSMKTTFPGNMGMWRAIENPTVHHLFYAVIIFWELATTLLLGWGTWKLFKARGENAKTYQQAKSTAIAGLTSGMLLWFVAFICVGGEWFLMWQSSQWNGQQAATRMFLIMGVILIFLQMRENETESE